LLLNAYSLGMVYIYMGQDGNLEIGKDGGGRGHVGGDVCVGRRKRVIYCCNAQKRKGRERSS